MVNLRVTPWRGSARKLFYTGTISSAIAKFFRSFRLRYCISPAARALSARRRGIKRCALCTVRHITGLTSPGKIFPRSWRKFWHASDRKKGARHVCNVTENIFSTSRRNFLYRIAREVSARKMRRGSSSDADTFGRRTLRIFEFAFFAKYKSLAVV